MKRVMLLLVIGTVVFALAYGCKSDSGQQEQLDEVDSITQETLEVKEEPGSDSTPETPQSAPPPGITQETLQVVPEEPVEKKGK